MTLHNSSRVASAAGVFSFLFALLVSGFGPGTANATPLSANITEQSENPEPVASRDITIQGCLEFTDFLIPGVFVIWCRPCDQVCIVILQPGVDDRAIFSVPDAPVDSPLRNFSAGDYSIHRSRAGVGIRVSDAKPVSD